ncbi:hypothetical protein ACFQ7J_12190 [Streptomyces sp. NPDC056501]|uniref:hypothetical protein n=1 Tax=Streptomyces sp. NPDC056501 TaxID=3345841 RepID=UPI003698480F
MTIEAFATVGAALATVLGMVVATWAIRVSRATAERAKSSHRTLVTIESSDGKKIEIRDAHLLGPEQLAELFRQFEGPASNQLEGTAPHHLEGTAPDVAAATPTGEPPVEIPPTRSENA